MADFPSINQSFGTVVSPAHGIVTDVAEDGTTHSRVMFGGPKYRINAEYKSLSTADKDSIMNHFMTNVSAVFKWTFDADGSQYNVIYTEAPAPVMVGPNQWDVSVSLAGDKI